MQGEGKGGMKVRNRDGHSVEISFNEIRDRIAQLLRTPAEHDEVDVDRVVITTINGIYDGITTSELDELSARVCADLQGVHFKYDVLAARILASNWQKNARRVLAGAFPPSFSGKTAYIALKLGTLNSGYAGFVAAHASELDAMVDYGRDDGHTYFALRTLERSYLVKAQGACVVETPQDMWMRVAVAIYMPKEEEGEDAAGALARISTCYDAMSLGMFTHATPTLFNAGTLHQQCSSCYLLGTDDSLSGIYKTISDAAQISKWAGGIGVHVSNVRAKGSIIRTTNGVSDGIVPMLKVYNETVRYCNQSGRRKGSAAIYLEPWHADVWEFVELRRNIGAETERCRDLFLALYVPDEFMRRVLDKGDWYLMSPEVCPGLQDAHGAAFSEMYNAYVNEGKYVRKIPALALWQHILQCQLETGVPYVVFKDHVNAKSNHANIGTVKSSNLCAEIVQYSDADTYAVCNLASIAVNRFAPDGGGGAQDYNHAALHQVAKLVTRNLDRIIDINYYPTPETRRSNMDMRPIGIGVQGLADLLCALKIPFETPEAVRLDASIMETIYHGALEASAELAAEQGPYPRFQGSPFSEGRLQFDLWGLAASGLSGRWDWDGLRARIRATGVRNSMLTALMPTASTSQILGNAECIEPFHSNVFKRTTLAGEFLVINRHLMRDLLDLGLWSEHMRRLLLSSDGSVQGIEAIPARLREVYKTVWEVSQRSIIDHALARGPFVDQSQSMNLFMATPSFQKLSSALIYGWTNGIKTGLYYLRSKPSTEAIKFSLMPAGQAPGASSNITAANVTPSTPPLPVLIGQACSRDNPDCEACGA